ncbi:MAG TPA: hypothetical protein VHD90_21505, partial [Phototrophicaceae bacterium]|nr:hypothetical protein [Phototrophicaceae bacterium]
SGVISRRQLLDVSRQLKSLGEQVCEADLTDVAHAIIDCAGRANRDDIGEQVGTLLLELSDTLDRVCERRTPQSLPMHVHLS